ncbi:hypothetical protein CB1_000651008 [Camelus ferus]|nr:hypothetical protein CB1_000651008 [Camelus ferus]
MDFDGVCGQKGITVSVGHFQDLKVDVKGAKGPLQETEDLAAALPRNLIIRSAALTVCGHSSCSISGLQKPTHRETALSNQGNVWSPGSRDCAVRGAEARLGLQFGNNWIVQKGLTRQELDLHLRLGKQLSQDWEPKKEKIKEGPAL